MLDLTLYIALDIAPSVLGKAHSRLDPAMSVLEASLNSVGKQRSLTRTDRWTGHLQDAVARFDLDRSRSWGPALPLWSESGTTETPN